MPSLEPKDSQFEPALLLALIVMVGIALGKDVFYDIMAQATAMTGLAILVFALVLPLFGIVERVAAKHFPTDNPLVHSDRQIAGETLEETPACQAFEVSLPPRTAKPSPERNAGSAGVRVLCGAGIQKNDNKGWGENIPTGRLTS